MAKISDAGLWRIANTMKKETPIMSKALEYQRIHLINRVSFASVPAMPCGGIDLSFMVIPVIVNASPH